MLVNNASLIYGDETVKDLVIKDTDGDSIPNWEESLWGTDPTKKETTKGIPDADAIAKLKAEQEVSGEKTINTDDSNLTQTDKFSREFFTTVTTLSQNGALDQATVDKLGSSLADRIQNTTPRKVFSVAEIKNTENDSLENIKNYAITLGALFKKYTVTVSVSDILSESITSDGNINVSVLNKLDPVIKDISEIINGMKIMKVPPSFVYLHLDTLNGFEKVMENLSDIKLVDSDTLVAISAISQYQKNDDDLKASTSKLINALR